MTDTLSRGEIFAFGLSIFLVVIGAVLMLHSCIPRKWHATVGQVLSSRTRWHATDGAQFSFEITYLYRVDGVPYEGSAIRLRWEWQPLFLVSREEAEWFVRRHPTGKEVRVLYDPRNPARAVLEHRLSYAGLASAIVGACILLAGLFAKEMG